MNITKEKLLERKKDLQGGLEELNRRIQQLEEELRTRIASRNANIVAMQEIDHWVKTADAEMPAVAPKLVKKGT